MENRIEKLREYIDGIILNMTNYEERRIAYVHLYGVSQFCTLIALKRKLNVELATMAGMLHDFYTYKMMDPIDHGIRGSVLAKETLELLKLTTKEETEIISEAIYHHSNKIDKFSDFTEILIDADVLQHHLYNTMLPIIEKEKVRLEKLKEEFGLN